MSFSMHVKYINIYYRSISKSKSQVLSPLAVIRRNPKILLTITGNILDTMV